ncbi:hypothetical protein [Tautonia plasticadhaerens]|uniref:hypothetical protein n=1 Tax=Tautonia plasticadhaerens TaxID=2527974 RepID=UPI0011A811BE|nr:hypothetical protein [Tautonia plasticadhaerens]
MTTTTKKKVRFVRPNSSTSSTPRLDSGETAHVGVDVHKASHHVAVVTDLRGLVASRTPPADPESLSERPKPIGSQVARVVYEAGPTGFTLARRLRSSGLRAGVIAPPKTPTMPGPEARERPARPPQAGRLRPEGAAPTRARPRGAGGSRPPGPAAA